MKLITLTPVHIGNGDVLKPLSYVTDRNSLYVLDMEKFFATLSEDQREKYLRWIDPVVDKLAELDRRIDQAKGSWDLKRQLSRQKRDVEAQLSIGWFIENRLGLNPVNLAKKCQVYQVTFSSRPGREGFRTHIKNAQNEPYIPGTEIKGAMRTSLLYSLLGDDKNYKIVKESLESFRSFFRSRASRKNKMEKLAKIADAQSNEGLERRLLRGKDRDAKYDFLKLIGISDTDSFPHDRLQISTIRVIGSTRSIRIWGETLNPKTTFHFALNTHKKALLEELKLERLQDFLYPPELLEACYHRSKEILEEEEKYFSSEKDVLERIDELKRENQPNSPLLRLGAGQGFLGTTIGLKVKQNDPSLYDEAIREGVSFLRGWETQPGRFPKTRRVIEDNKRNPVSLLGWVKLELT